MYYRHFKKDEYINLVGGMSYFDKIKRAVALAIRLQNNIRLIDKLVGESFSLISSFVLILMLEVLCCRDIDPKRARNARNRIQCLVNNDKESLIHRELKACSSNILKICNECIEEIHHRRHTTFIQYCINVDIW